MSARLARVCLAATFATTILLSLGYLAFPDRIEHSWAMWTSGPLRDLVEPSIESPTIPISTVPFDSLTQLFRVPSNIHYDSGGPRPDQIVLLTASDGKGSAAVPDMLEMALENRQKYCDYHGYICEYIDISKYDLEDAAPWGKIPAMNEAFNNHPDAQWVWWLDLDAIIMTPSVSLVDLILSPAAMRKNLIFDEELRQPEDLFPDQTEIYLPSANDTKLDDLDILIGQDVNAINSGSFFLRRSTFTQYLLDVWKDPLLKHPTSLWHEQYTLLHLLVNHPTFRSHLGIMKLRLVNSNSWGDEDMNWRPGDLVVHFAGCGAEENCAERWSEYWALKEEVSSRKIGDS